MKAWCIAAAVLLLVVVATAELDTLKHESAARRIYKILQKVKKKDRSEFIRYHLQKGHELTEEKQSIKYPGFNHYIDDEDTLLIYDYFSTHNAVTDEDVAKVARNIICWKDKCIDFSDPGVHP